MFFTARMLQRNLCTIPKYRIESFTNGIALSLLLGIAVAFAAAVLLHVTLGVSQSWAHTCHAQLFHAGGAVHYKRTQHPSILLVRFAIEQLLLAFRQ